MPSDRPEQIQESQLSLLLDRIEFIETRHIDMSTESDGIRTSDKLENGNSLFAYSTGRNVATHIVSEMRPSSRIFPGAKDSLKTRCEQSTCAVQQKAM